MTSRRALLIAALGGPAGALLAGCAAPPRAAAGGPRWSGRLALQVEGDAARSFTAGFDLRGSPAAGALSLFTPVGGTAALIEWSAAGARLQAPGQPDRQAASLDDLVAQATGSPLPVAALFDWLAGRPAAASGWQADLSQRAQGRLRARRLTPPAADLRLVLEEEQQP
ncbi:lipoprotein insertase outer membrane protein LolB [Ramlibacter sp. MAHUQ-53]|uniref:lipoprotein insertase outer membrane protein LolB n=1 Tax=unclassified Ramlibacter TaxID=2617605 RepID=UPI00363A12FD